jgi:hypothetical protein
MALPTLPDPAQAKPTQTKTSLSIERQFLSRKGNTIPSCGLPAKAGRAEGSRLVDLILISRSLLSPTLPEVHRTPFLLHGQPKKPTTVKYKIPQANSRTEIESKWRYSPRKPPRPDGDGIQPAKRSQFP